MVHEHGREGGPSPKAPVATGIARAALAPILLLCAAMLTACITPGGPRSDEEAEPVIARPDAPAEYDVLVGEFAMREARFVEARDAFLRAVEKDGASAQLHGKLARLEAQLDNRAAALEHAQKAVEFDPDDVEGRILLARLHRAMRDIPAMEAALLDDDGNPVDTTAALMLYQAYMDSERYAEALVLAKQLTEAEEANVNGYVAIATIHERMGEYAEAEAAFRAALALDPDDMELYARIARLHRKIGDTEAEIELYEEVLEDKPRNYSTLVSLAEAYVNAGRLDEAIATFEEIAEYYPEDLQVLRRIASLHFAAERYEESAAVLQRAFDSNPSAQELLYSLGQVERAMGDDNSALRSFDRIQSQHPAYVEARMQMVSIYEERSDFTAAVDQVQVIRTIRPSRNLEFHYAGLLARAGRPEEGIALLEAMLVQNPKDEETLYQLGVLHGLTKQTDEALRYMRAALELNPDNPNALNYIGYTFAEKGERLDEAEEMIRRALELRPDDGYITDSLGWVYYMRAVQAHGALNDASAYLEKARHHLAQAELLTGGDPVISEHLGDVYLLMEDKSRALEHYEEAVDLKHRPDEQPDLLEKLEGLRRELDAQ